MKSSHCSTSCMQQMVRTCKLFGVVRAASAIHNSAIVIHGPLGCGYNLNYILGMRGGAPPIFLSGMDQGDVVFGGEEKLRRVIERVSAGDYDLITVVDSCAPAVMGEDVRSVVSDYDDPRLIYVPGGGFEGDHFDGYLETIRSLSKLVSVSDIGERYGLNIIGEFRGGKDLKIVKEMLGSCGINIKSVWTRSTIQEIRESGSAMLNVPFCEAVGLDACRLLKDEYGTQFMDVSTPIGISGSIDFLESISDFFGKDVPDETYSQFKRLKSDFGNMFVGRKIALFGGPTRVISFLRFFSELGFETKYISLDNESEETLKKICLIKREFGISPETISDTSQIEDVDLIVGGLGERGVAYDLKAPLLDVMHSHEITFGAEGAKKIIERIKHVLSTK